MQAKPSVVVTRPHKEAAAWVERLTQQGFHTFAVPLIEITALPDLAPLAQAWANLQDFDAIMFVSGNAVRQFFASQPNGAASPFISALSRPRAMVTGPGSYAALLACGADPQAIDAPALDGGQFDSEALWQQVRSQVKPGFRVLIVRGDSAAGGAKFHFGVGQSPVGRAGDLNGRVFTRGARCEHELFGLGVEVDHDTGDFAACGRVDFAVDTVLQGLGKTVDVGVSVGEWQFRLEGEAIYRHKKVFVGRCGADTLGGVDGHALTAQNRGITDFAAHSLGDR